MNRRYVLPLVVAISAVQMACSLGGPSRPSQFYVLSVSPAEPVAGRETAAVPLSVALGPVSLPDILDRPQIVTRPEPNRLDLAEFDRWGGDLDKDLVRVLTQNLMLQLNTDSVAAYPWRGGSRPDFRLALRFFAFDGKLGERAHLSGIWELLDGDRGCQLGGQHFEIGKTPSGPGYPEFVEAMSAGLADLSRQMAVAIAGAKPGCQ